MNISYLILYFTASSLLLIEPKADNKLNNIEEQKQIAVADKANIAEDKKNNEDKVNLSEEFSLENEIILQQLSQNNSAPALKQENLAKQNSQSDFSKDLTEEELDILIANGDLEMAEPESQNIPNYQPDFSQDLTEEELDMLIENGDLEITEPEPENIPNYQPYFSQDLTEEELDMLIANGDLEITEPEPENIPNYQPEIAADVTAKELSIEATNDNLRENNIDNLIAEALEDNNSSSTDAQKMMIDNSAIKVESDLFSLDQDEFEIIKTSENPANKQEKNTIKTIENFTLEDKNTPKSALEQQIKNINVDAKNIETTEVKLDNVAAEKNINIAQTNNEDTVTSKENLVQNFAEKPIDFTYIGVKRKPKLSYKTNYIHPVYSKNSNHLLDKVTSEAELYQLLFAAIDMNNIAIIPAITKLIDINKQVTVNGQSPIIYAVNRGNINIIRKLIALKYPLNNRDDYGNSAVHIAVMQQRLDILTELIRGGADYRMLNGVYQRPINIAYNIKNNEIISALIKVGAHNIKHIPQ